MKTLADVRIEEFLKTFPEEEEDLRKEIEERFNPPRRKIEIKNNEAFSMNVRFRLFSRKFSLVLSIRKPRD